MTEKPVVFDLFNAHHFSHSICSTLKYIPGKCCIHTFPDEEILVKITSCVKNKSVIFIASLDRPNHKMATIIFAAETVRALGATKVGLIAPYLGYMRQDKQFHAEEGVTSKYFAKLISTYFDWLMTVDPHLHRWHCLDDIFTIPTQALHATHNIAKWITQQVSHPLLIGPDAESAQWVAEIAKVSDAPYLILEKTRINDVTVSVSIPQLELYPNHTPVLVDDIIATGVTMIETIQHIQSCGITSMICVGVHAIFADHAYQTLLKAGINNIATCNTIKHCSNKIDISNIIIDALNARYNTPALKNNRK